MVEVQGHSFRCEPRSQASPPIPERFICVSSARATRLCVIRGNTMPFVITDPCIGTKDTACVDVCPVDCIHPGKGEAEFAAASMLYIHPEECIDCGACVPVCPVTAIYDSVDAVPGSQKALTEANAIYRNGHAEAMAAAEAIVKAHRGAPGAHKPGTDRSPSRTLNDGGTFLRSDPITPRGNSG